MKDNEEEVEDEKKRRSEGVSGRRGKRHGHNKMRI